MTYQEAVEAMERFSGGTTWSLHYVTSSYGGVVIHGYLAGKGGHAQEARTYAVAIENVKRMLGIIPTADPPPEDGERERRMTENLNSGREGPCTS